MKRESRRSKLEIYIDVLRVLAHHGPLKLTHIMYKSNVNCTVLKTFLDVLAQQNLVEEQIVQKYGSFDAAIENEKRGFPRIASDGNQNPYNLWNG